MDIKHTELDHSRDKKTKLTFLKFLFGSHVFHVEVLG